MNKLFEIYSTKQLQVVGSLAIVALVLIADGIGYFFGGGNMVIAISIAGIFTASAVASLFARAAITATILAACAVAVFLSAVVSSASADTVFLVAGVAYAITTLYTILAIFYWCVHVKQRKTSPKS
jgi:hypothetical protein